MARPKQLGDFFVATIEAPGRYGDGHGGYGLSLLVKPRVDGGVSKTFSQRLRINGKARNVGLGPYPDISLHEARDMAKGNAGKVRKVRVTRRVDALLRTDAGNVPRAAVPAAAPVSRKAGVTVRQAAERVIAINRTGWKPGGQSEQQWRYSLTTYVYPLIGDKLVSDVTSADIMQVLTALWGTKRETASRVKQRIGAILDWAVSMGYRVDNPVSSVTAALPKNGVKVKHHAALPWKDIPAAVAKVRASTSRLAARLCFELLILTALRSGEARQLRWEWFDLDNAMLTIPAAFMKAGRAHRIPLSTQAVDIVIQASNELFDGKGLIFPGSSGQPLSDMSLTMTLRRLKIPATVHGFRSSFRDWCAENADVPREISEHALAHVEGSASELSYRRTDYFDKRRGLMQEWADFVCQAI